MTDKTKVLLVDDDPQLIKLVRTNLESEGYHVLTAVNPHSALELVAGESPDLIILDIMLPEMDGYELCQRIREFSSTPIIMLTAKVENVDKIKGLKLGADDYITKPFNTQELIARIEAVLRRTVSSEDDNNLPTLTCGDIFIDFSQRRVTVRGEEITLTLTEYKLLSQLAVNIDKVMLHSELLTLVWGAEYQNELEYLRSYIRHLRRKLEDDPHQPRYILSKPGIGYILVNQE